MRNSCVVWSCHAFSWIEWKCSFVNCDISETKTSIQLPPLETDGRYKMRIKIRKKKDNEINSNYFCKIHTCIQSIKQMNRRRATRDKYNNNNRKDSVLFATVRTNYYLYTEHRRIYKCNAYEIRLKLNTVQQKHWRKNNNSNWITETTDQQLLK